MISTVTQSSEWFIAALMIASIVGLPSYILIRWVCEKSPNFYLFICAFVALGVGLLLCLLSAASDKVDFVVVAVAIWASSTYTERAAQPSQESWLETFFKLTVATICSALVALVFLDCIDNFIPHRLLSAQDEVWFFNGYLTGAFVAPCAIPIFLWGWKTAHFRPGVDRHLEEGEHLE